MIKHAFYFILKALSALRIFNLKYNFDSKISEVTAWLRNNDNIHITQNVMNKRQADNEIWSVN